MNKKFLLASLFSAIGLSAMGQTTPVSQMENLDRGLVAVTSSTGKGNFVSWRFLGTDDAHTTFDLIRNGTTIASDLYVANYKDSEGDASAEYQVVTKVNGETISTSEPMAAWGSLYKALKLDRPATGAKGGTYTPNDCSVGDVDGDGQYELFVKWDPSNSQDNAHDGITDNVFIDCYKLNGTKLWRVDLGRNIRAGAHYTQFQVYDYDGDGKAEMMCKTAPGSKDALGDYVNQASDNEKIKAANNTKSWITSSGRMDGGHEYLTVFDGLTGKAIHTIAYNPNRNTKSELSEAQGTFNWAIGKTDNHGYNRGDRYLAATAYLDGPSQRPSAIFCRGYYSYAYVWAVDFDGQQLKPRWLHRSDANNKYSVVDYTGNTSGITTNYTPAKSTGKSDGSRTMFANGNHNMCIADVDGDGKDEIIWGSAALDDDGKMLYATGFGHGDAIHLADLDPDRPGLELFDVHEEKGDYAWDIHDAATGEIIWKGGQKGADNGRGVAADIMGSKRGYEFWSSYGGFDSGSRNQNPFNAQTGKVAGSTMPSMNFRIYWDGDLQDELLDGTTISKYNSTGNATILGVNGKAISDLGNPASCNGTKATPCLSADLFGDWREELILWSATDNATLNIYTTTIPTNYRVPTLMHDHTYRMAICWQNTAYNQPPHLGYYLPDAIQATDPSGIKTTLMNETAEEIEIYDMTGRRLPVNDVENLGRGLYLMKKGHQTIKIQK